MNIKEKENSKFVGIWKFTIRDAKTGKIKRVHEYKNLIPTAGRSKMAEALSGALVAIDEIEINKTLYNFTKQYISEHVQTDGKYSFDDAITELPFLCQERFGHGSEQTIRRYVKQLTCGVAPFQVIKDESNKKWIVRRTLN